LLTKTQQNNELFTQKLYLQIFRKTLVSYDSSNWSAILVDSLFKEFFIKTLLYDGEYFKNDFKITQRFTILESLSKNLNLITNELKIYNYMSNNLSSIFVHKSKLISNNRTKRCNIENCVSCQFICTDSYLILKNGFTLM
jgi:hypothetical protein